MYISLRFMQSLKANAEILFMLSGILILVSDVQLSKAAMPILARVFGNLTSSRLVQPTNAPSSKYDTPLGISIFLRLVHKPKTASDITIRLAFKLTSSKSSHCQKAQVSNTSTVDGNVTLFRPVVSNAYRPMVVTPSGISTFVSEVQFINAPSLIICVPSSIIYSGLVRPTGYCNRSEERRVGKECRLRWWR